MKRYLNSNDPLFDPVALGEEFAKLLLAFDALVLSEKVGRAVGHGKIIHGRDKVTWVNTPALEESGHSFYISKA